MLRYFILSFILIISLKISAQYLAPFSSAEILQGLKKLNTLGSVLYIAAHPDDENTRLLAYLAKENKLRTGYLSLTRGDGGQNLIGKEQGDALGLIRTQELLAARRVDGAEQFFTRANDFGYSKTPEETLAFWNKDSVLYDVVLAIRKFKPDVIICRFPTTGEGGHGHHTASALLAVEAFDAAADSEKFKDQLTYTQVWKAKRLLWNTFNFGGTNTTAPDQLKMDVGVFNPLLGKGYGEVASESRSMHKSQGFGSARGRGSLTEYFKLLKGDTTNSDIFSGMDQTWQRIGQAKIQKLIEACIKKYDPSFPELSLAQLTLIYKQIESLETNDPYILYWKQLKLKETENLLLACAGLWMEASCSDYLTIPGNSISLSAQIIKRNNCEAKLLNVNYLNVFDTVTSLSLKNNELVTFKHMEKLNNTTPFSNPYWLNEKHTSGLFSVAQRTLIGKPENDPALKVIFKVEVNGLILSIDRGVIYKYTDPVKGEVYRPAEILPPVTLNLSEKVYMFSDNKSKTLQLIVKANQPNAKGSVNFNVPEGWKVEVKNNEFNLLAKGEEVVVEAVLTPGALSNNGKLQCTATVNSVKYTKGIKRIEYDHIPYQFILSDAEANLVKTDLKINGTTIGYIPGAGDDVAGCLKQIGYNVTILTDDLLSNEDLFKYSAIITGVRAYNTTERLQVHYGKLMQYVNNGGNLIVQYNTNNRIGPVAAKICPYPFTISRDRVTDENADMRILKPTHSAFTFPNTITAKDFEGWVQERGIYFASDMDKNFESMLSINDPTEKASEGSLIIAKYGKGNFVYSGLAFFRQLPAGVPGAYRLFINLLSLPPNK